MDLRCDASGREPALQAQSLKFKSQSYQEVRRYRGVKTIQPIGHAKHVCFPWTILCLAWASRKERQKVSDLLPLASRKRTKTLTSPKTQNKELRVKNQTEQSKTSHTKSQLSTPRGNVGGLKSSRKSAFLILKAPLSVGIPVSLFLLIDLLQL
jgi:hypothetical protein